jgi:hypothetical protein
VIFQKSPALRTKFCVWAVKFLSTVKQLWLSLKTEESVGLAEAVHSLHAAIEMNKMGKLEKGKSVTPCFLKLNFYFLLMIQSGAYSL